MNNSEMEFLCTKKYTYGRHTYEVNIFANKISPEAWENYINYLEEIFIKKDLE